MQNAEMEQILALMNQYAAVLITLNERGVIRTYNSPVGDFAEWLVSQKLGLRLEKNSARGLDATGSDGLRYQIKCRWERTDFPTPQSRELGLSAAWRKTSLIFSSLSSLIATFRSGRLIRSRTRSSPGMRSTAAMSMAISCWRMVPSCGIPPQRISPTCCGKRHAFTPGKFTLFSLYRARFPAILWSKGAAPLKMCDRRIL